MYRNASLTAAGYEGSEGFQGTTYQGSMAVRIAHGGGPSCSSERAWSAKRNSLSDECQDTTSLRLPAGLSLVLMQEGVSRNMEAWVDARTLLVCHPGGQ